MKTLVHVASDSSYYATERAVAKTVSELRGPLFETDVISLFEMYLNGIGADRQHYNCAACRRFVEAYGGLVTITDQGVTRSALWDLDSPPFFSSSFSVMREAVERARVTGVFVNDRDVWGTPRTGAWTHLSGYPGVKRQGTPLKTAPEIAAEKKEEYRMLRRALADYSLAEVEQAVRVLEADVLDRSEKTLGHARWLLELARRLQGKRSRDYENVVWLAVAGAPPGFTHVRTSMIHTLLDDIVAGLPFDQISARWAEKMHPLQYRRRTAPVTDGAVRAANELVEKLGVQGSFARRFARLDEVVAYWLPGNLHCSWCPDPSKPSPEHHPNGQAEHVARPNGGMFDHLISKSAGVQPVKLPPALLTWSRFRAEVLPTAYKIEALMPRTGGFFGLVTAQDADSPPVLQWDLPDRRNPVSWFFFHGGSTPERWGLQHNAWVECVGICEKPCSWWEPEKFRHFGEAAYLVLRDCVLKEDAHGGIFNECLKPEFHQVSTVLEAHVRKSPIARQDGPQGNGIALQKGNTYQIRLRVNGVSEYVIDRWA